MATVTKTWTFDTTTEGLTEVGDLAGTEFYLVGTGSPAINSVAFYANAKERARTGAKNKAQDLNVNTIQGCWGIHFQNKKA